jgi:cell volume regulation protein A
LGVFLSLYKTEYTIKEKILVSWVGLRGAVPIILATFPLIAGIKEASWIFYVVFFIVLTSALLQGWTTGFAAKILKLDAAPESKIGSPVEFSYPPDSNMRLINIKVKDRADVVNKSLVQIPELKGSLIVTIFRNEQYFVPSGGSILNEGDVLQVLTEKTQIQELKKQFSVVAS